MSGADAWERLWSPHRMAYLKGENKPRHDEAGEECPFCVAPGMDAESSLVVARGEVVYAVLNLYPYNAGHLMVCPYRHLADYTDLDKDEVVELGLFTQRAMTVLREVSGAQGFNIGMNQGAVAGAGVDEHLHQHIVPRWSADANFFPIIARTKALPQLLGEVRRAVAEAWPTA